MCDILEASTRSNDSLLDGESSASPTDSPVPEAATRPPGAATHDDGESIAVFCRFRPENACESRDGTLAVQYESERRVKVTDPDRPNGLDCFSFSCSRVFPSFTEQHEVFSHVALPMLDKFFSGINCSILAYGQTGSGKTFTMMGDMNERTGVIKDASGVIPQLMRHIFDRKVQLETTGAVTLQLNFVELYMEKIFDLIPECRCAKGAYISKCNDVTVLPDCLVVEPLSANDAVTIIAEAQSRRFTAATSSNNASSRSHAIVVLTLRYHLF